MSNTINIPDLTTIYFEKAIELGNMVVESEASIRLADARAAFEADARAKSSYQSYEEYQKNMQIAIQSGFMTEETYQQALKKRIELEIELKSQPIVQEMLRAESEYNNFVSSVVEMLQLTIKGGQEMLCTCGTNPGGTCNCGSGGSGGCGSCGCGSGG